MHLTENQIHDVWYNVPMKAESFTEEAIIHPQ